MDFKTVINNRKAVRRFIPNKRISDQDIQTILKTVNLAPSAGNMQSFRIFVVKSKKSIGKIFETVNRKSSDFIPNAVAIFVFCADPEKSATRFGDRAHSLFAIQDATIAATYAILTATDLGYATCWVGSFQEELMKDAVDTNLTPVAAIVLGYPAESPTHPPRKEIHDIVKIL